MNKVFLIGRAGKDADLGYTNGTPRATFPVATTETWKDERRERQTKTMWHNCILWGPKAESLAKYIRKGTHLAVEGKIEYKEWTDDHAEKRKLTNIVVTMVELLGSPRGNSDAPQHEHPQQQQETMPLPLAAAAPAPAIDDSDLPF